MIDPRSVELFYWVVQRGGFRRAAEAAGTTQPAVSARIAALEAAVGTRLLDRGPPPRPTPAGLVMLSFAERQMALATELAATFRSGEAMRGTVRLGVAETLVHTWLSPLARRLHAAHAGIVLDIAVDVSVNLRARLMAGEIDLALFLGPVAAPGVLDLPLCEYELAFVAAPGAEGPHSVDAALLSRGPVITYPRQTVPYQQLRALLSGHAGARVFGIASLSSVVRMVQDGIGIGVIAAAAVEAELAAGTLRRLDAPGLPLSPLRFTASWREGPGSGLAAAVARLALEAAADHAARLAAPADQER